MKKLKRDGHINDGKDKTMIYLLSIISIVTVCFFISCIICLFVFLNELHEDN